MRRVITLTLILLFAFWGTAYGGWQLCELFDIDFNATVDVKAGLLVTELDITIPASRRLWIAIHAPSGLSGWRFAAAGSLGTYDR